MPRAVQTAIGGRGMQDPPVCPMLAPLCQHRPASPAPSVCPVPMSSCLPAPLCPTVGCGGFPGWDPQASHLWPGPLCPRGVGVRGAESHLGPGVGGGGLHWHPKGRAGGVMRGGGGGRFQQFHINPYGAPPPRPACTRSGGRGARRCGDSPERRKETEARRAQRSVLPLIPPRWGGGRPQGSSP